MTGCFNDLNGLIFKKIKKIELDKDIVLNKSENNFLHYRRGIEINYDDVVIDGKGHYIDAKGSKRIFYITGKNVVIKNLTFKNGKAKYGGAIRNDKGECTLINCKFENNIAENNGNDISNGPESSIKIIDCEFLNKDNNSILNKGYITSNQKDELDSICSIHSDNKNIIHTKLVIVDNDTEKLIGENHVLTIKLSDSDGNGVAGQLIYIGDLGIAKTGADGQAVFTWKSNVSGDKFFSINYKGKVNSTENYDYDAAKPVEGKFTTKTEHDKDFKSKQKYVDVKGTSYLEHIPFEAYEGDEPYIFISYKHADWKIVYPVIKKFHDARYNIWYDANLEKGKYYDIQIADHIDNSKLFITFITEEVIKCSRDEEDYPIKELAVAIDAGIERLPIFLEDVKLSGFYKMHYLGKQSILKHEYSNNEDMFIEACISAFKNFGLKPNELQPSNIDSVVLEDLSPAYEGDEPYIFLSYSRFDTSRIYPEIKQFQEKGYNIWYDECGIGRSSLETINKSIIRSSLFIVYLSNNSVESQNVRQEISLAIDENIPILPIYLEEPELKYGLKSQLRSIQSILKYQMTETEYVEKYQKEFEKYGFEINEPTTTHVINAPFEAYEGDEPYIFISYDHTDWNIVYPLIKKLHDAGFNIWYDANLEKGKNYYIQIAERITESTLFVPFITQKVIDNSKDAKNYLIKELTAAKMKEIKCLPIFLENVELDGFYLLHHMDEPSIFKHEYGNNDDMFIEACISTFKSFGLEPNE